MSAQKVLSTENSLNSGGKIKNTAPLANYGLTQPKTVLPGRTKIGSAGIADLTGAKLPVHVYDVNGKRVGGVWSQTRNSSLSTAVKNLSEGKSSNIYYDAKKGEFTNQAPVSSMSFSNGKIQLNVSPEVANSDWYKKNFSESDEFKDLAKLYAKDPTGETKVDVKVKRDGKETTESKTVAELLLEYAYNLKTNSESYNETIAKKDYLNRLTGGALEFTDSDIAILESTGTINRNSGSLLDTTPVFLPESLKDYFRDYESYNKDSGSMSAKEFLKSFYHLDTEMTEGLKEAVEILGGGVLGNNAEALKNEGESEKDYAMDLIRLKSQDDFNNIVERATFYGDEMTPEEKAEAATEIVKCYSLWSLMNRIKPDAAPWTGLNLAIQNIGQGLYDSLDGATGWLVSLSVAHLEGQSIKESAERRAALDRVLSFLDVTVDDVIANGANVTSDRMNEKTREFFEKFLNEYVEQETAAIKYREELESTLARIQEKGGGVFSTVLTAVEDSDKTGGTQFDIKGTAADLGKAFADAAGFQTVGRLVGIAIEQIVVINPAGKAAGRLFGRAIASGYSVATTGQTLANLEKIAKAASVFSATSVNAAKAAHYLHLAQTIANVTGFAANMWVQGAVESFLEDPIRTDALIRGADEETVAEFQDAIRRNIVFNAIGETVPFMGKKFRQGIKWWTNNTDIGAITQAVFRKGVNRITLRSRKILEGLSEFMTRKRDKIVSRTITVDGVEQTIEELPSWKFWQNKRKEIIKTQEEIKNTNIFRGGDAVANAKKIDELVETRIDEEIVLGIAKRQAIAECASKIAKGAGIEINVAQLTEKSVRLTRLSKKLGQINTPGSFSRETSRYINDLYNQGLLSRKEAYLKSTGKAGLSATEDEQFKILNKRISDYEQSLPVEIAEEYKELAKGYLEDTYNYFYKLNSFLASDAGGNVLSAETLANLRKYTQFGPNGEMYMPQFALNFSSKEEFKAFADDPSKVLKQSKAKNEMDFYSRREFSADTIYLDPNYTRTIYMNSAAQVYHGAEVGDAVKYLANVTPVEVNPDGTIFKSNEDIYKAKQELYSDLDKKFRGALKENRRELGVKSLKTHPKGAVNYYRDIKRKAKSTIESILGLNKSGLKAYAEGLTSEEVYRLKTVFSMPSYSNQIRTRAQLDTLYESLNDRQKAIVKETLNGSPMTVKNWNSAVTDNSLDTKLYREYIKSNDDILKSAYYKNIVGTANELELASKERLALEEAKLKYDDAETALNAAKTPKSAEVKAYNKQKTKEFNSVARGTITDTTSALIEWLEKSDNPYLANFIKACEKNGIDGALARRYVALEWLYKKANSKKGLVDIMKDFYSSKALSGIDVTGETAKGLAEKFLKAVHSDVKSRFNAVSQRVINSGVTGLADTKILQQQAEEAMFEITKKWARHQIVETFDRTTGSFKYFEVDRSTYDLVTYYPTYPKYNIFVRGLARLNSLARTGQILLRTASLVTQGAKDTLNAVILGGWDQLLLDDPETYKKIAQYIGPDVVEAFRKELSPSAWEDFLAQAKWDKLSVEEAIVKSDINSERLGELISKGAGTSNRYYYSSDYFVEEDPVIAGVAKQAGDTWTEEVATKWRNAYNTAKEQLDVARGRIGQARDLVHRGVNEMHEFREVNLRKQVYRQNYMDALAAGKSLSQARKYAQFVMENATTNFSRGFSWGESIVRSIPYFGAAVNGASSFVRLLEVDPVGIISRFFTDLVIPTVGLTALSLQNEQDAEIYKNIPEYRKEGQLIWVTNGRVETIPLPEELAKFILPFRHTVEKIANANDFAWTELMVNDLLNMPVVPLNGIMALDVQKIKGHADIFDRMSEVAMDWFNTLSPNAARTAYIAQTGQDPYTGKEYGREKYFRDASGSYNLMANTEYDFCQDMATLFNDWGWTVNAGIAEGVLGSLLGTGSMDVIEGIRDLIASISEGKPDITALVNPSLQTAGEVFYDTPITNEKAAQNAWYEIYYELKDKKDELLSDNGKLASISKSIRNSKNLDSFDKDVDSYNSVAKDWQNEVLARIREYKDRYGDYYDRSKFASTISLMTVYKPAISPTRDDSEALNARSSAMDTMYEAGFTSPSDRSIFGYTYMNSDTGEAEIRLYDPLVVSATRNSLWYQSDELANSITDVIELSGLKDKYQNDIYPVYQRYINRGDWDSANELAADWDRELVKSTKGLLDEYQVGDPFTRTDVINAYYPYVLIPSTDEFLGRGKYYSSKTGLSRKAGFSRTVLTKTYNALKENR